MIRNDESLELLRGCIRLRHHEAAERIILELLSPESHPFGHGSYLRYAYQSILATIVSAFADLGIPAMTLDEAVFSEGVYDCFDSAQALGKYLASAVRFAMDASAPPALPHGDAVEEVKRYIERNYQSRLSTRSLAARFRLHPNYLSSLFTQKTGCTVTRFVRETRINAACRLLTETSMSVAEVAELVGFDDPGYFHRVFRAVKGVTPQRMRDG